MKLDYVAGVSPSKWLRVWGERRPDVPLVARRVDEPEQLAAIAAGEADLAFVRLPVDTDGLFAIPLWEEVAVAVLAREHPFADAESLTLADLDGEPTAPVQQDPAMTVELVAAGTGFAVLPHGVARLHHRKDVAAVPLEDAPPTRIALVWRKERDDETIQEFVGVVRGRKAASSRGAEAETPDTGTSGSSGSGKPAKGARSAQPAKAKPKRTAADAARIRAAARTRGRGKQQKGRR
nr:LysR family substrate-binding domain-containing protein [Agromyces seonyuensis]